MTKEQIIQELNQRLELAKENLEHSNSDIRTPGFNQNLGYHDALGELLEWINENEN
jgi:hypothetical protein